MEFQNSFWLTTEHRENWILKILQAHPDVQGQTEKLRMLCGQQNTYWKKAKKCGRDLYLSPLEWRNTCSQGIGQGFTCPQVVLSANYKSNSNVQKSSKAGNLEKSWQQIARAEEQGSLLLQSKYERTTTIQGSCLLLNQTIKVIGENKRHGYEQKLKEKWHSFTSSSNGRRKSVQKKLTTPKTF